MRNLVVFLMIFISGCSSIQKITYLIAPKPTISKQIVFKKVVGVEDIELPYYLQDGKIPYVKDGKIEFFNSFFANSPEDFIKKRAINILKNSYKDAYDYPWENKSADLLLKIYIKKFITIKNTLVFEASYEFYSKDKKLLKRESFKRSIVINEISDRKILSSMMRVFDEFISSIHFFS